jgi:HAD superfamily hydrolase (TIGR01484 family)
VENYYTNEKPIKLCILGGMTLPKLIIFDLDDTLSLSKTPISHPMTNLLSSLLQQKKVAITSGASFAQFEKQLLTHLSCTDEQLANLYLLPTDGGSFYIYKEGWKEIYKEILSETEKQKIITAFEQAFAETGIEKSNNPAGNLFDDRGSQITFSALGIDAALEQKRLWDPEHTKRKQIIAVLTKLLPNYAISVAGTTSIDVTKAGIDKAYGIKQLLTYTNVPLKEAVYVGDALFEGGNDAVVIPLGIAIVTVNGPKETATYIESILAE